MKMSATFELKLEKEDALLFSRLSRSAADRTSGQLRATPSRRAPRNSIRLLPKSCGAGVRDVFQNRVTAKARQVATRAAAA